MTLGGRVLAGVASWGVAHFALAGFFAELVDG